MSAINVALWTSNVAREVERENNMGDKESIVTCVKVLQKLQSIDDASFT